MAVQLLPLSGSSSGQPVKVAATSIGSGTTVHTATSSTDDGTGDQIYLFVTNTSSSPVTLTVAWGGTTDPDHLVVDAFSVPPQLPPVEVVVGLLLRNSLVVRAAGGSANVLLISGFVHRWTA